MTYISINQGLAGVIIIFKVGFHFVGVRATDINTHIQNQTSSDNPKSEFEW